MTEKIINQRMAWVAAVILIACLASIMGMVPSAVEEPQQDPVMAGYVSCETSHEGLETAGFFPALPASFELVQIQAKRGELILVLRDEERQALVYTVSNQQQQIVQGNYPNAAEVRISEEGRAVATWEEDGRGEAIWEVLYDGKPQYHHVVFESGTSYYKLWKCILHLADPIAVPADPTE